jgi:hypothetical protein
MMAIGGFLFGTWAGGMPLRASLADVRAELDAAQTQTCASSNVGQEIASVLQGRPWEAGIDTPSPFGVNADDIVASAEDGFAGDNLDDAEAEDGVNWEFNFGDEGFDKEPENMEEAMAMAREAMDMRSAQAWAALDEQADLSDEQSAAFNEAVDQLNAELMNAATELVDTVQSGEEPTRREGLVFADNLLGAILEADDAIYNTLSDEQRGEVDGEVLDPLAYVDSSIVDKLMELDVGMNMEFDE